MAQKSVIEIDVLDDKFKAFSKELEKVIKALQEQKKVLKETASLREMFSDKFKKSLDDIEKKIKSINPAIKDMVSNLANVNIVFKGISTVVGGIVTAIEKIGKFLVYGALASSAAMIGIATNASNVRRTALSYGVSTGNIRAARGAYGAYVPDIEQMFGTLANMQQDPNQYAKLTNLGLGINENIGTALPRIIENAVNAYKATGGNALLLKAMGITDVFDMYTLRGLANLPERGRVGGEYLSQSRQFGNQDKAYATFQKLKQTVDTLVQTFEDKLIVKLNQLAPVFGKIFQTLSDVAFSLIDAFGKYLSSDKFKQDSEQFVKNISELASVTKDFFAGENFQSILKGFSTALTKFSYIMDKVARFMGYKDPKHEFLENLEQGKISENVIYNQQMKNAIAKGTYKFVGDDPQAHSFAQQIATKYGLPVEEVWKIIGKESSFGRDPISSKGAMGYGGFMPKTASAIGLQDPFDFKQSAEATGKYLAYLYNRFGSIDKAEAAYNWGEGNLAKALQQPSKDWRENIPSETQHYIGYNLSVNVQDNTENSTIRSTATLVPVPSR